MPVNPAYRGFLAALDAIERGEDEWTAYERDYLAPNRAVLTAYWRQCWGTDEERIREAAVPLGRGSLGSLRRTLEALDVELVATEALGRCASLIDLPEARVDLLVGRFSPDAFLFEVAGEWHIGVGLERFERFDNLPLLVAHEYGHYARRLLRPGGELMTVGERVVSEGVAASFAAAAYPDTPMAKLLRMSPRRVHEIRSIEARLWAAISPHFAAADDRDLTGIVEGAIGWRGFPPRCGCYLGYVAVRDYAQACSLSPVSRQVVGASAEKMLARHQLR